MIDFLRPKGRAAAEKVLWKNAANCYGVAPAFDAAKPGREEE